MRKFLHRLKGSPRARFVLRLAVVTLLVSLASFTNLLNILGIDDWLERLQLDQMEYSVAALPAPSLRLLYIEGKDKFDDGKRTFAEDEQLWRRHHAKFLQALANGPKLVAFDLTFPSPNDADEYQKANEEFVNAVRGAATRILLGANLRDDNTPDLFDAFKDIEWGWVKVGGKRLEYVRRYFLARSKLPANAAVSPEPAFPSLAVMMRIAEKSPKAPASVSLDVRTRQLILYAGGTEVDRISCEIESDETGHRIATLPLRYTKRRFAEEAPYVKQLKRLSSLSKDYKGQILLIGAKVDEELFKVAPEVTAYGYQLHASVFSDLSRNSYPRSLPGWAQVTVLLLLGLIAGIGRSALPKSEIEVDTRIAGKRKVPAGLLMLLAVYAVVVWIFYRSAFVLFDVGYGAIAVIAAYYFCGVSPARRKARASEEA
ncbi:MAG TPA: CHASE2 domain-containing protein [Thermoanaerobaculia bacterium]|nr:CHASE2 domain-containing protein [Thermoanaerobaculia bacterium]